MSASITPHCPVCNSKNKLSKCAGCKVVPYCSKEHQVAHHNSHKAACNAIQRAQKNLDREEQALRSHPGDMFMPTNVFEDAVGHFWGIHETRDYMRARYALIEALLKVKQFDAVQAAFDHIMDILRLCRSDNMGVRSQAPALFLRLGKDQECYDFIKWWSTTGERDDYDWGDMDMPYLDLKGEDVFEPVDLYTEEFHDLGHTVAITLLKIKLLLDVKALHSSTVIGEVIPQEVLDNIRGQLVTRTVIIEHKDIMEGKDHAPLIEKLESQVEELFKSVNSTNKFFWPALLNPRSNLTARPSHYSPGTKEHMQLTLQFTYDAWAETPGAIDIIRDLVKKGAEN
ncbi:hypothetical protein G7Y89_g10247 [Cudoniella acicularis]|uniref:MYND-type domain-containing protein n=1 Tax=Cudoniella acicularis TaxID=354080 RepID=A0A8H4RD51_9HELO|nr:hypothetical protein G7Y89_g10247 [Cudoniella acicularis]